MLQRRGLEYKFRFSQDTINNADHLFFGVKNNCQICFYVSEISEQNCIYQAAQELTLVSTSQ